MKSTLLKAVRCYFSKNQANSRKPKITSKHFERGIKLWDEGNIEGPLYEGMTIQQRLRSNKEGMAIAKISLKFKNLMRK